ncbi:CPSF-A domain-containing protein [Mycena chlorophos]|uniref:CPSF-A domain-containing protein n=1 Tax=Mycena chlorophos TaxID=658473 RepID=A0A8H6VVL0_MYCCL|nr:CPSF-A domain-containing protein [Mycena chlorophos]
MKLVSTFHAPTTVVSSVKANLANTPLEYLVIARPHGLEVSSIHVDGLKPECKWGAVFGNILSIKSVPTGDGPRRNLLVLVDQPHPELIFLEFKDGKLNVTHRLDLFEHKPAAEFFDHNSLVVHPDGKLAVVSCYTGKLRLVRLKRGNYHLDSDAAVDEYTILGLTFLPPAPDDPYPLALLFLDPSQKRRLIAHSVDLSDLDISREPSDALHPTALPSSLIPIPHSVSEGPVPILIPVPCPAEFQESAAEKEADPSTFFGGVLVVGGKKIVLFELPGKSGSFKQGNKRRRLDESKRSASHREQAVAKEQERYNRKRKAKARVDWPWSEISSYEVIDEDGPFRVLLGDTFGRLAMLSLHDVPLNGLVLIPLGQTSPSVSLTYLSNSILYVGSHVGNSQLVEISEEPLASSSKAPAVPTLPIPDDIETVPASRLAPGEEKDEEVRDCILETQGTYLRVVDSFKNIAPILDAALVDTDDSGHLQIVTCSGGQNTGSINVIRKGADFQLLGSVPGMQHLVTMFAFKRISDDSHILVSTLETSQVMEIEARDKLQRIDPASSGFVAARTLAAKNIQAPVVRPAVRRAGREIQPASVGYKATSFVVQVTKTGAFLFDFQMESEWERISEVSVASLSSGVDGLEIVAADINASQTVLALSNGSLACLEVDETGKMLKVVRETPMPLAVEMSALSCQSFDPAASTSDLVAVAYWQTNQIQLLDLAGATHPFAQICTTKPLPAVVRSLLMFDFGGHPHVFAGLGNGSVAVFEYDPHLRVLGQPKLIPPRRAAVITWGGDRVQSSPVMLKDIVATAPLHNEHYQSTLLLTNESTLSIGQVRDVDHMHIRPIPSPRVFDTRTEAYDVPQRIVYEPSLKVFGVAYSRERPPRVGEPQPFPYRDIQPRDLTKSTAISQYEYKESEEITAVTMLTAKHGDDATACFCVGSYVVSSEEQEPKTGRLTVFAAHPIGSDQRASNLQLHTLAFVDVPGCLYSLATVNGLVAAGVNSIVFVYRLDIDASTGVCSLEQVAKMNSNYFVMSISSFDNRLVLGDRIASLSLVELGKDKKLETLGRDLTPLAPNTVQAVDGKYVLAANDTLNLLSFTYDEAAKKLDRDGYYQQCDLVNKFVQGSITSADPTSPFKPIQMFFTASGRIGIISDIPDDQLALDLTDLQRNMYAVVEDGARQKKFRTPQSTSRRRAADEAYGFLDGSFLERLLEISDSGRLAKIESGSNEPERLKRPIAEFQQLLKTLQSLH